MKVKLAAVIILGLVVVGGLFLLKGLNSKPFIPAVPGGTGEQPVPSTPAQTIQKDEPAPPQSSATGNEATPGTATAFTITPSLKPGISQQTPTPTNPIPPLLAPTLASTEGVVGKSPTPLGRSAPDFIAEPLKFVQIRIFMKDTGVFSGIANVSNTGEKFLNALAIKWRIVDRSGNILDQGELSWPNLAPGETATLSFDGTNSYSDAWEKVIFEFEP